eukprot:Polyplicarium_translucidae@DN874_c0_g1_i1.p2
MEQEFEKATNFVRTGPAAAKKPSSDDQLAFYKFFKQATDGDVSGERPGVLSVSARAKYDAWASVKGTSKADAMEKYVKHLEASTPGWRDVKL